MTKETKLDLELSAKDKFTRSFEKLTSYCNKLENKFKRLGDIRYKKDWISLSDSVSLFEDSVKSTFDKIAPLGKALGVLGGLGVTVGGGLLALANSTAQTGREIARLSQAAGISTSRMQELHHAATMTGLESEELSMQMATLNEHIVEAGMGNEDLTSTFDAMGISVKKSNGELKNSDTVLLEMADVFSKMEDGPAKSAIAIKLFGDAGLLMLPMLSKGSLAIEEMAKEAHDLGLVMGEETISQSQKFTASMTRLIEQGKAFAHTIGAAIMPPILTLMTQLQNWVNQNRTLINQKISEWVAQFGEMLPQIITGIQSFFTSLATLCGWISSFVQYMGGAKTVLGILLAILAGPLLMALAMAGKAFLAFGLIVAANPIGLLITILAGAITLIKPLREGFISFFKTIAEFVLPDWLLRFFDEDEKEVKLSVDTKEIDDIKVQDLEQKHNLSTDYSLNSIENKDIYGENVEAITPSLNNNTFFGEPLAVDKTINNSSFIKETIVERSEIRLILPDGVKAVGVENAKGVSVDSSGLGFQTAWG